LASIVTIVIGVGLMVQAFNSAAENSRVAANAVPIPDLGGEMMVDCLAGIAGIVLGVLALVGVNAPYLVPSALIVFGGALLLSGALAMRPRASQLTTPAQTQVVSYQGSAATGGMEILVGMAAIVLGILSLIFMGSWVLVLVGFIAVGAALLLVSATFSGTVMRLFTAAS
jgi:nucleoside permease NupC